MEEEAVDASELRDELLCGFLAHARTAGDVVRSVAHESQQVDDLAGGRDAVFGFHFLRPHDVISARVLGAVHAHPFRHELSVVFVRCHHIGVDALPSGFGGQGSDHVVGLIAAHFQDRDAVGPDDVLYNRYGKADGFRGFLALRFVLSVGFVAECRPGRVESHADVGRLLCAQHFFQRVDEAQNGRSVLSFGVDPRVLDKRIISPINQGVCVQQE